MKSLTMQGVRWATFVSQKPSAKGVEWKRYMFRRGAPARRMQNKCVTSPAGYMGTPKLKFCAWENGPRGRHTFEPVSQTQIFCCRECQRADDRDRPRPVLRPAGTR